MGLALTCSSLYEDRRCSGLSKGPAGQQQSLFPHGIRLVPDPEYWQLPPPWLEYASTVLFPFSIYLCSPCPWKGSLELGYCGGQGLWAWHVDRQRASFLSWAQTGWRPNSLRHRQAHSSQDLNPEACPVPPRLREAFLRTAEGLGGPQGRLGGGISKCIWSQEKEPHKGILA
jgi:hypothetical protein